jgi:hypothetical protein
MAEKTAEKKKVSVKHLQLDKSQSTMLAVIALAVVITIFSLFATKAMIVKGAYQRRALHETRDVAERLKSNYTSAQTLFTQYKVFVSQSPNLLDGNVLGSGNLDGDNSISVIDDPTTNSDQPQTTPQTKPIVFSFEGTTNYGNGAQLLQDFERSIRPFDLNTLEISGSDNALRIKAAMTTYFQPAKSLT